MVLVGGLQRERDREPTAVRRPVGPADDHPVARLDERLEATHRTRQDRRAGSGIGVGRGVGRHEGGIGRGGVDPRPVADQDAGAADTAGAVGRHGIGRWIGGEVGGDHGRWRRRRHLCDSLVSEQAEPADREGGPDPCEPRPHSHHFPPSRVKSWRTLPQNTTCTRGLPWSAVLSAGPTLPPRSETPALMYLESIREPSDLRSLSYDELDELAGEIRDFIVAGGRRERRPPGLEPRRRRADAGRSTACSTRPATPSCGTPGTRRTCTRSSPAASGRVRAAPPGRRAVGLPEPRGVRARLRREQPRLDDPVVRLRAGRRPRQRRRPGPAPHRRRHRRRLDDRRHGVRGAEQPRPLRPQRHHRAQRQRPLATRRRSSKLSNSLTSDPAQPRLHAPPAADARTCPARRCPLVGRQAEKGVEAFKAAVREYFQPPAFFESLGVRYVGPGRRPRHRGARDGHAQRHRVRRARSSSTCSPRRAAATRRPRTTTRSTCTTRRSSTPRSGRRRPCPPATRRRSPRPSSRRPSTSPRLVAITAAMPGPTGLLPFQDRFPDRFFDVGIAEQHAVTGAAGMAMGGLRPVVAIYSTFLNRAWDQVVYDVALHRLPGGVRLDRAGITGDDGAEPPRRVRPGAAHEGAGDDGAGAVVGPGAAADAARRHRPVDAGPVAIRYPKGPGPPGARHRGRARG